LDEWQALGGIRRATKRGPHMNSDYGKEGTLICALAVVVFLPLKFAHWMMKDRS
jgi:hypothetical protein